MSVSGVSTVFPHISWQAGLWAAPARARRAEIQKALAARVPVLVGAAAPTSLAAEFARTNGQALVGFLRAARLNVYAGRLA